MTSGVNIEPHEHDPSGYMRGWWNTCQFFLSFAIATNLGRIPSSAITFPSTIIRRRNWSKESMVSPVSFLQFSSMTRGFFTLSVVSISSSRVTKGSSQENG